MGEELGGGPGVGGNANRLGCPSLSSEVGAIEGMEQRRNRSRLDFNRIPLAVGEDRQPAGKVEAGRMLLYFEDQVNGVF